MVNGSKISVMSIPVSDQDRARSFYEDVLGFELVHDSIFGEGMRWVMLRPPGGGSAVTLVTWFPSMKPGDLQGTVLSVTNVEEAAAQLRAKGVLPPEAKIEEAPWGRWVSIKDPDGNGWVVQQDR